MQEKASSCRVGIGFYGRGFRPITSQFLWKKRSGSSAPQRPLEEARDRDTLSVWVGRVCPGDSELLAFSGFLRQLRSGYVFRMGEQKGFKDVLCWAALEGLPCAHTVV